MELIMELLQNEQVLQVIIGLVVTLLGATKLSKETVERVDEILQKWAPIIVRATMQKNKPILKIAEGVSDVTKRKEQIKKVKREMKAQAVTEMKKKVPVALRVVPKLNDKIDDVIESAVFDMKPFRR